MNPVAERLQFIVDLVYDGTASKFAADLQVSISTVTRWLTGVTVPNASALQKMQDIGIDTDFLVRGSTAVFTETKNGTNLSKQAVWKPLLSDRYRLLKAENMARNAPGAASELKVAYARSIPKLSNEIDQMTVDQQSGQDVIIPMFESNIPAGYKVPIYEDLAMSFNVTQYYKDCFTMRVRGDSMLGSGIEDGDRVIIRKGHRFRNGDVVAAMVDGEVTLKGIWTKDDRVYLVPANSKYPVVELPDEAQFQCLGVCIDTFRPPKKVDWREK